MIKKESRDELIGKVALLEAKLKQHVGEGEFLRKQLTSILMDRVGRSSSFYSDSTVNPYSWIEIASEIGKLLSEKNYGHLVRRIEEINNQITAIELAKRHEEPDKRV